MALVVDKELIEIVQSNLLVNDIIMSAVLLISVAIFFVNRKHLRTILASSCILALMMPLYIILYSLVVLDEKIYVSMLVNAVVMILAFSPTNFILIFILLRINAIARFRLWSVIALFSASLSWLGIAALIYGMSK